MAQELSDKIRAAAQERNIDPELALRIARAESALSPTAKAKTSTAGGLFQVTDDTWKAYGGKPGKKFDPDENIRVGLDIIASNQSTLKKALGRDPSHSEVYAAHYFGPQGAKSFLAAAPDTPIESILGKAAIKANPNLKGKTASQVLASLEGKVGGTKPAVPRETAPTQTEAEKVMEPALRSGMTAQAKPATSTLANLGPSYQAALALSVLADSDETKGEKDIDNEPSIAEKFLADSGTRPTALAQLNEFKVRSPFPEPQQPQAFAGGGGVSPGDAEFAASQEPVVMMNKGGAVGRAEGSPETGEVKEPGLLSVPTYSKTVAYEMYPGQQGQFDQQDAARHMLAAGTLARKYGPSAAEMLGNLHEITTSPMRWIGSKLGISEMPVDYEQDLHNNRLGIEAAKRSTSQKQLEDLVQQMAEQARGQKTPGSAWIGKPVKRAGGSPETGEQVDLTRPATVNPNIRRQGEAAKRLAAMRGVNTLPDPRTYAAVSGFLGTPPDEQGFSALHPDLPGIKQAGEAGFYAGTAAQVAPVVGSASKMLGKLAGSALNERLLAGQSLTPGFNTPAPINFAVKPKGGVFIQTQNGPGISKLDDLLDEYALSASRIGVSDEVQDFIRSKAGKYFTTTFGTADDPLRTAIRERRLDPYGRDLKNIPPYLVDAAKFPQARGHLQAKQELERAYDELTGIRATALGKSGSPSGAERAARAKIDEQLAAEGVPIEARNVPSVDIYSPEDFSAYPSSTRMLQELVNQQEQLPQHVRQALQSGEIMYDVSPRLEMLSPSRVVEALAQIPPNKLKNMSFPEAIVQGSQALAPVREYRTAIEMADRGAKLPVAVLQQYTQPVADAASGKWVQITNPVATELEGKLMKHSVGGYGAGDSYGTGYTGLPYGGKKAFDEGLVRVFSLRDKEGMPTITVEMARPKGEEAWNVTQVRGRFNSEPMDKESVFNLFDKIDETEGLGKIKPNSYSRAASGADTEGTMVDWGKEYDMWKSGTNE